MLLELRYFFTSLITFFLSSLRSFVYHVSTCDDLIFTHVFSTAIFITFSKFLIFSSTDDVLFPVFHSSIRIFWNILYFLLSSATLVLPDSFSYFLSSVLGGFLVLLARAGDLILLFPLKSSFSLVLLMLLLLQSRILELTNLLALCMSGFPFCLILLCDLVLTAQILCKGRAVSFLRCSGVCLPFLLSTHLL